MGDQTTAGHLVAMLRAHYQPPNRPPAGVFAAEISSPDGTRRADAIWMPTTVAGGTGKGLHGHEIKVARSDLLAELDDPTKADPWARYCHRWWLVVPAPQLADGLDIPETWGVMAPPTGRRTRSMTIVKPAPALRPSNPAPGYERLARWLLYGYHERVQQLEQRNQDLDRQVARLREQVATRPNRRPAVSHPNLLYTYEIPSNGDGDWKVVHSSQNVREVEQLVAKVRACGQVEGRDFRARVEFTEAR